MRIVRLLLLIFTLSTALSAFNHPEIKWKSVTTEHFIINYYDKTEPAVYAAWKISEESYKVLARLYKYKLRDKIALSLAEYDDFSNGYAEWTSANIMIWLPDSRFDLRSNTTWLRNVITHELAHVISLENRKKMQVFDFALDLSYSTPDEHFAVIEPFPRVTAYPSWLAEGIAQFETEQLGNDCFDSRREMVLRCAVMSGTQLSLNAMSSFNHDRIGSELVYNQGYALTRYIAGKFGPDRLQGIMHEGAGEPVNFFRVFSEETGMSLQSVYDTWIDSVRSAGTARFSTMVDSFITRIAHGKFNLRPEIAPDGNYWSWLSSGNDDGSRTDLIVAPYGSGRPVLRVPYAHTAQCFSAAGDRIYYIKSRRPNRNGSYFNDIFYRTLPGGAEQRLTTDGRIYDIAPIPGSTDLLCISYRSGAFGLYQCNTSTGFFTRMLPGEAGSPIVNVSVNPQNPSSVVFSRVINGKSTLFLMSTTAMQPEQLTSGSVQAESPYWAADGRIYFSADYDGVFNIYSLLPDRSGLVRHTSTGGGYFSPKKARDGTIAASFYSGRGFSLVRVQPAAQPSEEGPSASCTFKPLPVPQGKVTIKERPYQPKYRRGISEIFLGADIRNNNSLITGQSRAKSDTSVVLIGGGLSSYQTDALHKRQRFLGMQLMAQAQLGGKNHEESDGRYRMLSLQRKENCPFRQKAIDRQKPASLRSAGFQTPVPYSLPSNIRSTVRQQTDTESTDSAAAQQTISAVATPAFAVENSTAAPTVGFEMSTQLYMLLIPAVIQAAPYLEYQFAREWTGGVRLNLASAPFNELPLFGSMPFYISWEHPGIYNEDISYNHTDVLQLQLSIAPQFMPGQTLERSTDSTGLFDTTLTAVGGIAADLGLFCGVPLFRYAAIQLSSFTSGVYHDEKTLDDLVVQSGNGNPFLHGLSNSYLSTYNGIKTVFPVIRTIDRGRHYYFDALYGYVGYHLFAYMNSSFFDRLDEMDGAVFSEPGYRPQSIFVEHIVSAGFELGHYVSYFFFKQLSFDFNYYILDRRFSIALTSGF